MRETWASGRLWMQPDVDVMQMALLMLFGIRSIVKLVASR
jgi:hypothetical protein